MHSRLTPNKMEANLISGPGISGTGAVQRRHGPSRDRHSLTRVVPVSLLTKQPERTGSQTVEGFKVAKLWRHGCKPACAWITGMAVVVTQLGPVADVCNFEMSRETHPRGLWLAND